MRKYFNQQRSVRQYFGPQRSVRQDVGPQRSVRQDFNPQSFHSTQAFMLHCVNTVCKNAGYQYRTLLSLDKMSY